MSRLILKMRKHYFDIGHFDSDTLCPQNQEMPYEVIWSTDSSLVGRKRGVQRDFVPTVKPVYTYATRKSANETPASKTHQVGSHDSQQQTHRITSGNQSLSDSFDLKFDPHIPTFDDLKFDGSMFDICSMFDGGICSMKERIPSELTKNCILVPDIRTGPKKFLLKISNTVDVPFRLTVKPTMTLKFIRTVLGKTENELPDDSISELNFSVRPYATQNISFSCLGIISKISKSGVSKIPFLLSWLWTFSKY